ncbi:Elapor1 [Symbiodinium necroappetens]|uniref:Elapor1 protein n=1 Tax=Symbiodinium necroappetens TaxID=1628268 RepID=A0A812RK38_9DINO|nr:Elapor1 [Symbiodinium necroappetens]
MRCCCALAAACICLFAVQGAIAPTRACAQSDWRFSFGVCHEGLRHIYPYTQRCDETKSPVKPSPLFNVSCHKTCPAGTHLAAKLRNGLTVLDCVECKPGYFSLGGGLLISGQAGDWHRSWPPGLRTGCSYRRLDGSWHTDGASTTGLTTGVCQIQILSPPTVAGAYYIRATHTRSKGTRSPPGVALFVLAPGDRRLCSRISGNLHPQASGFTGQRPGASQADNGRRSLNFWLLAAAGGCSYDRKAQVAGMAGAQGVVLAPAAILDIGAGPHGPPEHSPGRDNVSRTVPIYEFLDSQDAQVLAAALRVRPKGHAEMILNDTAVQLCSEPEPSALPEMGTPGNVTYGCNAWTPDELGNSIHSGDNRNFNRMVSSLELSVNIVRKEGYVVFRYQVDAEEGYDGFSFEVDWKEVNSLKAAIGTLPQLLDDLRSHNLPESAISDAEQNLKVGVNLLEANLPRICFLGKTGSGKTSLMNALLGKTLLPAEDTGKVLITVNECSVEEWREKKRMLVNVMQGGYEDDAGVDVDDMQNVAEAVLKAACPDVAPEEVQLETPEAPEFLQRLENSSQRDPQHFQCSEDARKFLVDRVHLASSDDWVQSVLTSRVLIRGNFPNVPQDCIMVDLPGLEDTNLLRSSVAERYFDLYCNHAWFCLAKTENRIGSNAGLSRQIRALARGGNLDKILLVRTRADEAPKKGTEKLDREHEEFKRLCLQELTKQSSRARSSGPESEVAGETSASSSSVPAMSFAGYVQATADPGSEDRPPEIKIEAVVRKLQHVGAQHIQKLRTLIINTYEALQSLARERFQEEQEREAERQREVEREEARRRMEALERQHQRLREEQAADERRRQHLEELRQARERRAQEAQSRRANLVLNFTQALNDSKRMVQERIGFHMLSGKAETVMRGGIYASTSRGNFDLVDTFCGALTIRGHAFDILTAKLDGCAHVLRWQYAKDYSGYTGMDRAQLQLVQVVGTQYADLECFHCHGSGMHSIGGADHCNACLRNQYLSAGRSASLARCQPCPAGKWSVPGSVSAASCVTAEKCTSESFKVALSPCQSGRQHQVRSWILPVICDVNDSLAAALLQGAAGDQECVPCAPNTYRPNNAECVPKTISCPAGHYAVTELVLSRWAEWPKNLSQEVIGPHEEVTGTADVPGGWALNNGSLHMTLGVGGIHITDKLEARLHLDVQVTLSPGRVNFTLELPSAVMWADMRFLVDGVVSSNIPGFHVEQLPMRAQHVTRFQVTGPLWPGRHRLTWSCLVATHCWEQRGAQREIDESGHFDLRRVRLVRVAVQGAANAGSEWAMGTLEVLVVQLNVPLAQQDRWHRMVLAAAAVLLGIFSPRNYNGDYR